MSDISDNPIILAKFLFASPENSQAEILIALPNEINAKLIDETLREHTPLPEIIAVYKYIRNTQWGIMYGFSGIRIKNHKYI